MSKRKIRKGRAAVAAMAAVLPLGLGTAAWAGGDWGSDTSAESYDDASAAISQNSDVSTYQESEANTGYNAVLAGVWGANATRQWADASANGGNIGSFWFPDNEVLSVDSVGGYGGWGQTEENTAGNYGGTATNDSSASNDGDAAADVSTGAASATNSASTDVSQDNSGGASASSSNTVSAVDPDGGDTWAASTTSASLSVSQNSDVSTEQGAYANTGDNMVAAVVYGANLASQAADASANGGDIAGGEENVAGNTGGTAGNTSTASNLGTASATLTTGNATASNSSTTNVTQTNSGGASATSTNDVSSDD